MRRVRTAFLVLAAGMGVTASALTAQASATEPLPTTAWLFKASLEGGAVVPGPGDPDATGELGINPNRRRGTVCYGLDVANLDTITGLTIHKGRRGQEGPARLTLFADPAGRPGTDYHEACVTGVRKRLIKRITEPRKGRRWYVEVRSAAYPDGAVRGQLGPGDYVLNLPDARH